MYVILGRVYTFLGQTQYIYTVVASQYSLLSTPTVSFTLGTFNIQYDQGPLGYYLADEHLEVLDTKALV